MVAAVLLVLGATVRRVADAVHSAIGPMAGDADRALLERRQCEEAVSVFNGHVAEPFESVRTNGVWARTIDDYMDHHIKADDLESMEYNATRCQTIEEAIVSNDVPPWCPSVGDPSLNNLHFNTTSMQRYSFSVVSRGICWRSLSRGRISGPRPIAEPETMNSIYRGGMFRGGMLSLPNRRLADHALCFYPRDAGSCMRTNCGCGKTTHSKNENTTAFTPGEHCTGARAYWRNATTASVDDFVRTWWKGNRTHEDLLPSLSASVFEQVGLRQLVWDNPYEVVTSMRNWHPGYNEVVVPAWFGVDFADVPIDALYYFDDENPNYLEANVGFMRAVQRSYHRHSGRLLPLFKVDVTECHSAPFSCA